MDQHGRTRPLKPARTPCCDLLFPCRENRGFASRLKQKFFPSLAKSRFLLSSLPPFPPSVSFCNFSFHTFFSLCFYPIRFGRLSRITITEIRRKCSYPSMQQQFLANKCVYRELIWWFVICAMYIARILGFFSVDHRYSYLEERDRMKILIPVHSEGISSRFAGNPMVL